LGWRANPESIRICRGRTCPVVDTVSFIRTDEQVMLADTMREFLASSASLDRVRDASLTADAHFDDVWQSMAGMGIVGLAIEEQYGGAGYGFEELAVVFEELGAMVTPVPLLSSVMASTAIAAGSTDLQKEALLPGIASGETIATVAVFENAHDHASSTPGTIARPSDNGWVLTGTKRWVTDAMNADQFIVSAHSGDGVGLFVVEVETPGVTVAAMPSLDATRPLGEVVLEGVPVPHDAYLGDAPHPVAIARALDAGVVAMASEQVGGARACLDASVDYAKTRYQFGRQIGSFQAIKHMCADMLVAVEHARSVAWHAAATFDDLDESRISVPLAKSVCSDAFLKVAGDNIQVHGGIGFTWEHDAHLYFKRAKADSLLLGSVDSYRDRLADAVGI
jgi:alkylation response protein AidB-like acyl-CoA dehydrogenase